MDTSIVVTRMENINGAAIVISVFHLNELTPKRYRLVISRDSLVELYPYAEELDTLYQILTLNFNLPYTTCTKVIEQYKVLIETLPCLM